MCSRTRAGPNIKPLKNIATNRPFLRWIPIHIQTVLYINEKWRTNAEKLIGKFMRVKLVKKINMPNPIKIVVISSDTIGVVCGVLKASAILSATTFKRSTSRTRRLGTMLEIRKKASFLKVTNKFIIYKRHRYFT